MQYGNGGSTVQFDTILVERLDGVARITLNRPDQANALSQLMLTEIGQALDALDGDANVRAIIVRGAGAAFSSGF
ncbi:MAG: enoyl-CoA hydratase/isomerase family protein, partial [Hyphomicrobiaceae bacterium]